MACPCRLVRLRILQFLHSLLSLQANQAVQASGPECKNKFSNAKNMCKKNNLEFLIDEDFILNMWITQNGKCFYSGKNMEIFSSPWSVSIDRKDSSKGYTKDNIVLCCAVFNRMKLNYSINKFIELCNMVSNFNKI